MNEYTQLNLIDYVAKPIKTQREEDILYAVNHGSSFEKGKIRILNYYNSKEPSTQEFADYLCEEYGTGGCGCGFEYSDEHRSTHFKFKRQGREYFFNWLQWAKEVAKIIDNDEYDVEGQMKTEYYKSREYNFWTEKHFTFSTAYNGKKIVVAYLTSVFDEPKGFINYDSHSIKRYTTINTDEIGRAITSGAYNNVDELWEDIYKSGRFINKSCFGGHKSFDEEGLLKAFNHYKKDGTLFGYKVNYYEPTGWEFWQSKALHKGIIDYDGRRLK